MREDAAGASEAEEQDIPGGTGPADAGASGRLGFTSGIFDLLAWPVVSRLAWNFVITAAVGPHVLVSWFLRCLRLPGGSRLNIAGSDWLGWWECILISLLGHAAALASLAAPDFRLVPYLVVTTLAAALAAPLVEKVLQHYADHLVLDGRRGFTFSSPYSALYLRVGLLMLSSVHPHLLPLAVLPVLRWLPANLRGPGVRFAFTGNMAEAALRLGAGTAALQMLDPLAAFLLALCEGDIADVQTLHWVLYLILLPFLLGWWLRWIVGHTEIRRGIEEQREGAEEPDGEDFVLE